MVNKARAGKKNHGTNHIVPSWRGPHVTGEGTFHHPRLRRQRASAHTSTASSPSTPTPALSSSATTSTPISATPPQLTKGKPTGNTTTSPPPLHRDGEIKPNLEPQNPSWIHKSPVRLVGMILQLRRPIQDVDKICAPSPQTTRRLSSVYQPAKMLA